jgi:hypothetical protein
MYRIETIGPGQGSNHWSWLQLLRCNDMLASEPGSASSETQLVEATKALTHQILIAKDIERPNTGVLSDRSESQDKIPPPMWRMPDGVERTMGCVEQAWRRPCQG